MRKTCFYFFASYIAIMRNNWCSVYLISFTFIYVYVGVKMEAVYSMCSIHRGQKRWIDSLKQITDFYDIDAKDWTQILCKNSNFS